MARTPLPPSYVGGRVAILALTIGIGTLAVFASAATGVLSAIVDGAIAVAGSARAALWPW